MFSLKDHYHELDKAYISKTNFYSQVKKLSPLLHEPKFALRDCQRLLPRLTYRKINDWDRKGLISGSRENKETGWRKFSRVDLVKLFIIEDLRKFGMDIESIKSILKNVITSSLESKAENIKKTKFLQLEHAFCASLIGNSQILLIGEYKNVSFFDKKDAVNHHFGLDEAKDPLIVLPFFLYVEKIKKFGDKYE